MKKIGENAGFVKLPRTLLDDPMWTSERFTKGQAWVDLLMLAQGVTNTEWEEGRVKTFYSGTVYCPIEGLAERWKWNRKTVSAFLKKLAEEGKASTTSYKKIGTQIKIENWDYFNGKRISPMDMQTDIKSPCPGHGELDISDDFAEPLQNKDFGAEIDNQNQCPKDEKTDKIRDSKLGHNKEEIKKNKEVYYVHSEAISPSSRAPLLIGGADDGSGKTKDDIPKEWRDDFDSYEAYWRWRNQ